jgi:hypothetical protein
MMQICRKDESNQSFVESRDSLFEKVVDKYSGNNLTESEPQDNNIIVQNTLNTFGKIQYYP